MSDSPASSTATLSRISRVGAAAVSGLIWVYQHTVSPALSVASPLCGCRFAPTCSHYAQQALREHGLGTGLVLAARRLAKCGPWHPGGIDPVPPRQFSCVKVRSAHAAANTPSLPPLSSLS
ncbi:MAG: membrane protein insertion efficiency factor YidD [Candidatus Didemnitutus sp.]|nr:membrane protein insertion efficiency factor YidD [Candidatus Didemnitutus sp.]